MSDCIENIFNIKTVIIPVDNPIPIAYTSLYEEGDIWIRTQGCEACSVENRKKCCGNCPMVSEAGCYFHLMNPGTSQKPFNCIKNPIPTNARSFCALEFQCVKGSNKDKIRCVRDKNGVLR